MYVPVMLTLEAYLRQGTNHTRQPNVLQMMKDWKGDLSDPLDDSDAEETDKVSDLAETDGTSHAVKCGGAKTFASSSSSDCSEDFKLKVR